MPPSSDAAVHALISLDPRALAALACSGLVARAGAPAPLRFRQKAEIAIACALVPLLLELLPATRVLCLIASVPPRPRDAVPPERLALHVDRLLLRAPLIWHHTCLRRAATLVALLRRSGRDARVVLGVRRAETGELEAHAWVECAGEDGPYLERGEDARGFVRLEGGGAEG